MLPVAVVSPLPPYFDAGQGGQLSGATSTGNGPFVFHWTQDAGPTITVPFNNTTMAATPTVVMPTTVGVLKMALVVTDLGGVDSLPTEFTVRVARGLPVAQVDAGPPPTVYAGQSFLVGSTGSHDNLNGTGVVGWEWSVLPGTSGITITPQGDGSSALYTMPMSVPSAVPATVRLVVTNGLGLRSNPAQLGFTLSSMMAPTWTLDAGNIQVVPGGSTVTLSALASAPGPATFSYQWSPAAVTDAGTNNFALNDPAAPATQFIAPVVSGQNLVLSFDVTATVTSGGLTPANRTAQTVVAVQDQRPPQVAANSILAGSTGSPFGAWLEYDENIQSATPMTLTYIGSPTAPSYRPGVLYGARRGRVELEGFAPAGTQLRIFTGQVRDTSPYMGGNMISPSVGYNYFATYLWPIPAVAADSSTEPTPALIPVPLPLGEAGVYLVGRKSSNAVFHQLMPLDCTTACSVTEDTTAPGIALTTGKRPNSNPYTVAGGIPYVLLQAADFMGTTGIAVARKASGWVQIASPPGSLFASSTTLYSTYVSSGAVLISTYDAALDTWSSPVTATTSATDYSSMPGSPAGSWGLVTPTGRFLIATTTTPGGVRSWAAPSLAGPFITTSPTLNPSMTDVIRKIQVTLDTTAPGGNAGHLGALRALTGFEIYGFGSGGTIPGQPTTLDDFDQFNDVDVLWVATIEQGQVTVYYRGGGVFNHLIGPHGTPQYSLNFNPTCVASSPALTREGEHVALAWQERCGTGPYKMYVRWVR